MISSAIMALAYATAIYLVLIYGFSLFFYGLISLLGNDGSQTEKQKEPVVEKFHPDLFKHAIPPLIIFFIGLLFRAIGL